MVAASMTNASARVAAKAGRSSAPSAARVAAFSAPVSKNLLKPANGKTLSASVAARVSSVKVRLSLSWACERLVSEILSP